MHQCRLILAGPRSTEVQGFKALESFRRQDRQGELNISVADRFWVKIDGEGLDHLEGLKAAAQQMDAGCLEAAITWLGITGSQAAAWDQGKAGNTNFTFKCYQ